MRPRPSHYEILGVQEDADTLTITTAYKNLSRLWHPNSTINVSWLKTLTPAQLPYAREVMDRIITAYEILSDVGERNTYDILCREPEDATETQKSDDFCLHWQELKDHLEMFLVNTELEKPLTNFGKILEEKKNQDN